MNRTIGRWLKFIIGLCGLLLMFAFFASGYDPPGPLGEVLRHNMENDIDASPLFYSEVENMSQLEDGVRELMRKKELSLKAN
jgi:hypothetical protein